MAQLNKIIVCFLICLVLLMSGCYTAFKHPKTDSNGEPLNLGNIYMENGCVECHQDARNGSTTILPDGTHDRYDWEFFYLNAWWQDSFDLPPIRTQYIDYDEPAIISGPRPGSGPGPGSDIPPPSPHQSIDPGPMIIVVPENGTIEKIDIPEPKRDDRRTTDRRDKQTTTPAPRDTKRRSDQPNSHDNDQDSSRRKSSSGTNDSNNNSNNTSNNDNSGRQSSSGRTGSRSGGRRQ